MTVFEKAKEIVDNGMDREEIFAFFNITKRDIIEYVALFHNFGIAQDTIWNLYEEWQQGSI